MYDFYYERIVRDVDKSLRKGQSLLDSSDDFLEIILWRCLNKKYISVSGSLEYFNN